jgi:hypothetical protein
MIRYSEAKRRLKVLRRLGYKRIEEGGTNLFRKTWTMEEYEWNAALSPEQIFAVDSVRFGSMLTFYETSAYSELRVLIITGGHGI